MERGSGLGAVGAPSKSRVGRALVGSDQQDNREGGVVHQQGIREPGYGVEGGNTPDSTEHPLPALTLSDSPLRVWAVASNLASNEMNRCLILSYKVSHLLWVIVPSYLRWRQTTLDGKSEVDHGRAVKRGFKMTEQFCDE